MTKMDRDFTSRDPVQADAPARQVSAAAGSRRSIVAGLLCGALFASLLLDQLLLWRFLGFAPWWLYVAGAAAGAVVVAFSSRTALPRPALRDLSVCFVVALMLYLLGGEGRLFYANADWQVRDAVLRDLTSYAWPFAYPEAAGTSVLRAPLGMYLLPAIVGKAFGGAAADMAMLFRHSAMLAILLALGSILFSTGRARLGALTVFIAFSGLDIVGQLIASVATGESMPDHLEFWSGIQFSSHITQAFWVPQHAMAGWIAALLFLLWKDRRLPLGIFLAAVPLVGLWSPLALMGALPFAALAGARTILDRALRPADILLPAATTVLVLPGLLYLAAGGGAVGIHLVALPIGQWALFELVETAPFIAAVVVLGVQGRAARATLVTVVACLFIMPFVQVGDSVDFTMRASIPALAILAVMTAQAIQSVSADDDRRRRVWRAGLIAALAIGSVTGLFEIRRSLAYRASPRPACNLIGVFDRHYGGLRAATYLAPVDALPKIIRPDVFTKAGEPQPPRCWAGHWATPR
jgi:hypothetical protein